MSKFFSKELSERAVAGGFGSALLLLSAIGIISYLQAQELLENKRWTIHTYEVMDAIDQISDSIREVESGQLGYIVSKKTAGQEPYQHSIQSLEQAVKTVRYLTRDNLNQQRRLDKLQPLIDQRLVLVQQVIPQQQQLDSTAQINLFQQGAGIQRQIQADLNEMANEERMLLQRRSGATDSSARLTFAMGAIGYLLSFGLLLGVYLLLRKQIQDRQQAEIALRQANEQLELGLQERIQANAALQKEVAERIEAEHKLEQLATSLRHSNQELEQFAYVASHDLQEPLRAVTSYTQMLSRKYQSNLDDKADKYIGYIVDGATRMQQLIQDLLTYSRVGRQQLNLKPTDCNAVLEQVFKNLQMAIAENNAIITYDPLPIVMADLIQLTQLFQNLVGNAIKYRGDETPKIHISATQENEYWVFSVQDNGIGIEPQYAERIFIIFQRLHTRREYSGTGIGLAICKKIVDLHGGTIKLKSQLGEGCTFYFTLPV